MANANLMLLVFWRLWQMPILCFWCFDGYGKWQSYASGVLTVMANDSLMLLVFVGYNKCQSYAAGVSRVTTNDDLMLLVFWPLQQLTVLCFLCFDGYSKRQPVRLISAKFSGATEKTQLLHKTTAKHEEVTDRARFGIETSRVCLHTFALFPCTDYASAVWQSDSFGRISLSWVALFNFGYFYRRRPFLLDCLLMLSVASEPCCSMLCRFRCLVVSFELLALIVLILNVVL